MFTIWGSAQRSCDGLSRRNFLKAGTLGIGGLTLADLLRLRAQAAAPRAKPKSVIMVCLDGGPSHVDMYDMKPTAPAEIRGEFKPIQSNVPGFDLCELMPLQAQIADKMTLVRSMQFLEGNHDLIEVFSGFPRPAHRPAFGSVVSRLTHGRPSLPNYISLSGDRTYPAAPEYYENPGYAGGSHKPFMVAPNGGANLRLHPTLSVDRLEDRQKLLGALDGLQRRIDPTDVFTAQAFDMLTSPKARAAFDLSTEPEKTRLRYCERDASYIYSAQSDGPRRPWYGEKFLLARRLAEAGVPVVTLRVGHWDHHGIGSDSGHIFKALRSLMPLLDRSLHALITDLYDRGLDQDVAVLVWGEFGRTPRIDTKIVGRGHWIQSGFSLFAGGGFRMGQVIGQTDAIGAHPRTRPWGAQNVLAMLYHVLGIDPEQMLADQTGRPIHVLDNAEKIPELL